jgi:RNA polymerase sigma factor (sigma-70 family)
MVDSENVVLQGFARSLIRRKAQQLVGYSAFRAEAVEDIEQELTLRLLRSLHRFDAEKAHVNVWTTAVVDRQAALLLRKRRAKKRDAGAIRSLDAPTADGEPTEVRCHRGTDRDVEQFALRNDVAEVLAQMPAEDRDLAERLMEKTVPEVARDLNVPRSTLQRNVERLRRRFEDASMRDYL